MALGMSGLVSAMAKVFSPIVSLLTISTNGVLRLIGIDPNEQDEQVSEEEIRMILEEGSQKGVIDQDENEIIQNLFEFDDLSANEIATHRTELAVLWLEETEAEWEATMKENNHTFYPVCKESLDDIVGILDSKIYFRMEHRTRECVMEQAVNKPYFIPETVKADVLFRNMKECKNNIAVVIDEYGGVNGIITINDLIEQLLGDFITREQGKEEIPDMVQLDETTWKIRGCTAIDEMEELMDIHLAKDEYDTFNGLVFYALGKVPEDGTTLDFETEGLSIHLKKVKDHMVEEAVVCKMNELSKTDEIDS